MISRVLFLLFLSVNPAFAQSKFFSTPGRSAEGSRAQAQMSAINSGIATQRVSLTTVENCGNEGMIFGPQHALANGDGCIPSLQVSDDGRVDFTGALKLGDYSQCNASLEGTVRYAAAQKVILLCDGSSWVEVGAAPTVGGTFAAVTNAQITTQYTSNAVTISGFFGTRTGTTTNGAIILVNNVANGTSAEIKEGDTIALRMTSAGTYDTAKSTNFTVGSLIASWSITTRPPGCAHPSTGALYDIGQSYCDGWGACSGPTCGGCGYCEWSTGNNFGGTQSRTCYTCGTGGSWSSSSQSQSCTVWLYCANPCPGGCGGGGDAGDW